MRKLTATATLTTSALAAAALALGLAAPAGAASIGIRDANDSPHGSDLRSVVIRNTDTRVVVKTTHDNLRRHWSSGSAGSVYIDTDRTDKGPEYVFAGAYFQGSDYQLLRTEGFGHENWGRRVRSGPYGMKIDYDKEQVRMRMSRAALGRPGDVRVAVRVAGTRSDGTSKGLVDWLGSRREFTPWVARG
jgi:hypothetical protein